MESPTIFSDQQSEKKVEWKIQLYPKGDHGAENKNFIGVFLYLHNNAQTGSKHSVTFKITLMNKTQTILAKATGNKAVKAEFDQVIKTLGHPKLLDNCKITSKTLPGDELHVKCEVAYAVKHKSLTGSYPNSCSLLFASPSGSGSISHHLKHLMDSKMLSDVLIQVEDTKFDAHKCLLSARSSVFLAMFQSDFTETQTNTLKIEGIEPAVFKEVLRFIYTDEVEQLDELAVELLAAAERYMLNLLKSKCEAHLAEKISVENCDDLLLLADLYSAAGLKVMVLDFFRSRAAEVAKTASWQQLMLSANPHLLRDISMAFVPQVFDTAQP